MHKLRQIIQKINALCGIISTQTPRGPRKVHPSHKNANAMQCNARHPGRAGRPSCMDCKEKDIDLHVVNSRRVVVVVVWALSQVDHRLFLESIGGSQAWRQRMLLQVGVGNLWHAGTTWRLTSASALCPQQASVAVVLALQSGCHLADAGLRPP